ncbi:GDSL-type esterase/lipase family protein [Niallia nealsonii]|uniref:GDSL family lipase n=1 Tax=Niallia nealsonii TaxID=115979 RepID=A0A2N0Z7B9_9BACI|nr:GDSL-type esterase/lipase family protein [Niallia nealsonii]PKG25401.1 GDSL family lipase [Niallia nealsonii]
MKKYGTIFILLFSILFCFTWIIGLGWVLVDYSSTTSNQEPKEALSIDNSSINKKDGIQLLALGDSLTRGTGDDTGKGYVGYLKESIEKESNQKITLSNYGIKGLTSAQLAKQIKETEIKRKANHADILFITIGGNDLFQGGETLKHYNKQAISALSRSYTANLKSMLSTLRSVNKDAPIYLIGLYNPFNDLENSSITSGIVRNWNNETAEICAAFANVIYVPTYDIFQQNIQSFLYSDHFHPNAKGYRLMAERVAALISWEVETK